MYWRTILSLQYSKAGQWTASNIASNPVPASFRPVLTAKCFTCTHNQTAQPQTGRAHNLQQQQNSVISPTQSWSPAYLNSTTPSKQRTAAYSANTSGRLVKTHRRGRFLSAWLTFRSSLSWHRSSWKKSSSKLVGCIRFLFLNKIRALQKVCKRSQISHFPPASLYWQANSKLSAGTEGGVGPSRGLTMRSSGSSTVW